VKLLPFPGTVPFPPSLVRPHSLFRLFNQQRFLSPLCDPPLFLGGIIPSSPTLSPKCPPPAFTYLQALPLQHKQGLTEFFSWRMVKEKHPLPFFDSHFLFLSRHFLSTLQISGQDRPHRPPSRRLSTASLTFRRMAPRRPTHSVVLQPSEATKCVAPNLPPPPFLHGTAYPPSYFCCFESLCVHRVPWSLVRASLRRYKHLCFFPDPNTIYPKPVPRDPINFLCVGSILPAALLTFFPI